MLFFFLRFTPAKGFAQWFADLHARNGNLHPSQIAQNRTYSVFSSENASRNLVTFFLVDFTTLLFHTTSPATLLRNLHQILRHGVIMGLPVSWKHRMQVIDPRRFWQNETGGAVHCRGWWLFRHRSSWVFLSVCCLPAAKASLSPCPSLMGSSGFEEITIHAFNWWVFYRGRQKYGRLYWLIGCGWQIWPFPVGSLCGGTCRCQAHCLWRTACFVFYKTNGCTVAFSGLLSLVLLWASFTT